MKIMLYRAFDLDLAVLLIVYLRKRRTSRFAFQDLIFIRRVRVLEEAEHICSVVG